MSNTCEIHDDADESLADAYHDGYFSLRDGSTSPHAPGPLADAWAEGRSDARAERRVRVQPVERPEGYYHMALCD